MLRKIQKITDELMTGISALMLMLMFLVIMANVVLRLIPFVGGFSWYMEFSQYANVWAMLLGAVGVAAAGTNLRVEAVDTILERITAGRKIGRIILNLAEIIFYGFVSYSGYQLATRAKQMVSTMPSFKMGQVYAIFPVAGVLCILAALLNLLVELCEREKEA